MPRRTVPTGTRLSTTIPPGLAQRLVNHPKVAREMARVVREIADLADTTVPVGDTGRLKASQETAVLITPEGVVGVVAYTAFYAHMVHNGTRTITANPWLLNAAMSVLVGSSSGRRAA